MNHAVILRSCRLWSPDLTLASSDRKKEPLRRSDIPRLYAFSAIPRILPQIDDKIESRLFADMLLLYFEYFGAVTAVRLEDSLSSY